LAKRLHPGRAAENGVSAAYLARRGFTGPTRIFEASWGGFLKTYGQGEYDESALTEGLGRDYRIMMTGFKPYASCRGVHSAIDSLLQLQSDNGFGPDDVEQIAVTISPFLYGMVGNAEIRTMLDAQMSLPYGLAVTLLTGDASIAQYSPEKRSSDEIHRALSRIRMNVDESIPPGVEPRVDVHLRDGRTVGTSVETALGAAENPLSDEALSDKFRSLVRLAYPESRVEALLDALWNVDRLDNLQPLVELLAAE
jgi:2-methylcitrate dehydratase PrpD